MTTCGGCHDTAFIAANSDHADVGLATFTTPGGVPGGRPWDSSDGPFGRWDPLLYRLLSSEDDAVVDLTTPEWVRLFGARHAGGGFTVYVPTAPLPTQGFVYHLPGECVQLLPQVRIEVAMRMVFACGAGAAEMFANVSTEEGQPFPIKR